MDHLKIIAQVCEHAQASGLIKTLQSAEQVGSALKQLGKDFQELQALRGEVDRLKKELSQKELSGLHS